MNDRDRLIELIADIQNDFEKWCVECAEDGHKDHQPLGEYLADKLLQNGVIVPPCKVAQTVYYISFGKVYKGKCHAITIHENSVQIHLYDYDGDNASISANRVFLTKEEAERELEKRTDK